MKLGFPITENRGLESHMAEDLSRASHLLIYDTKSLNFEVVNEDKLTAKKAGSTYLRAIRECGVEGLFFKEIYPLAFRALSTNDFTLYKANSEDILDNISVFLGGEAPLIEEKDFAAPSCSGSCSSCSSTSCN